MTQGKGLTVLLRRDLTFVVLAVAVSVPLGLMVNALRSDPLPWRPLAPEERLLKGLTAVSSAASFVTRIGLDEAIQASNDEASVFVDARPRDFYQLGRIAGALNLSPGAFREDYPAFARRVRLSQRVIVYCAEADCEDSLIVAKALIRLGFSNVAVFEGGWGEWEAADLPREP